MFTYPDNNFAPFATVHCSHCEDDKHHNQDDYSDNDSCHMFRKT